MSVAYSHPALSVMFAGVCSLPLFAGPKASVVRQKPFNLFEPGQKVEFQVKGKPGEIAVGDYDGNTIDFSFADGKLAFGELKPGYYEIRHAGGTNSFAVAPFVHLSASDFLKEGRRFGLKTFLLGKPGVRGHALSPSALPRIEGYAKDSTWIGAGNEERNDCLRELALARALYRLDDADRLGERSLRSYVDDPRRVYASYAKSVLSE